MPVGRISDDIVTKDLNFVTRSDFRLKRKIYQARDQNIQSVYYLTNQNDKQYLLSTKEGDLSILDVFVEFRQSIYLMRH